MSEYESVRWCVSLWEGVFPAWWFHPQHLSTNITVPPLDTSKPSQSSLLGFLSSTHSKPDTFLHLLQPACVCVFRLPPTSMALGNWLELPQLHSSIWVPLIHMCVCKDILNYIRPKSVCTVFLSCSKMVSNKSEQWGSMVATTARHMGMWQEKLMISEQWWQ